MLRDTAVHHNMVELCVCHNFATELGFVGYRYECHGSEPDVMTLDVALESIVSALAVLPDAHDILQRMELLECDLWQAGRQAVQSGSGLRLGLGVRVRPRVDELHLELPGQVQKPAALSFRLNRVLIAAIDELLLRVVHLLCTEQYQTVCHGAALKVSMALCSSTVAWVVAMPPWHAAHGHDEAVTVSGACGNVCIGSHLDTAAKSSRQDGCGALLQLLQLILQCLSHACSCTSPRCSKFR